MKMIFLFTTVVYVAVNCSDTKTRANDGDDRIYSFLNYFLQRKAMPAFLNDFPLIDQELTHYNPDISDSLYFIEKGVFTSEDWQYIVGQTKLLESFKIDSNKIKVRSVISPPSLKSFSLDDDIPEMINFMKANYGVDGFNTLSRPLFSLDGTRVLIRYVFFEKGGGMGGDYVFVKRVGGWELLNQLKFWEY